MIRSTMIAATLTAVTAATFAIAQTLPEGPTRTLRGLEGPANATRVSNAVVGRVSLASEGIESLKGRSLRGRYWTIGGAGGVVPIHDHANRPAMFVILTGEIFEFRSDAPKPILHKTDDLAVEDGAIAHWWITEKDEEVRLIAYDVFRSARNLEAVDVAAPPSAVAFDTPAPKGATRELYGAIDIGKHFNGEVGVGQALTFYKVTLEPGGVQPSFTDAGEPALMFVWRGEVVERRADAAEPIARPRESHSSLAGGQRAYWTNESAAPAVLFIGAVEPLAAIDGVPQTGPRAH